LYHRVLQLEGPLTALEQAFVYPPDVANEIGHEFATSVGCTQTDPNALLNCLATGDLQTLVSAWQSFVLLPVFDGDLFPVPPTIALTNASLGLVKKVPTFMVVLPDPGTEFILPLLAELFEVGWENYLIESFGDFVGPLLAAWYPDAVYGDWSEESAFVRGALLISDSVWLCPLRRHATYMKAFTSSVYVAQWNVEASFITNPDNELGIVHGTEVPFLFGNHYDIIGDQPGTFTPQEYDLSQRFMKTVGHFLRKGDLGSDYPVWTPEIHAIINLNNVATSPILDFIRFPPPGFLPEFPNPESRCALYDYLFALENAGVLDGGKIAAKFARNSNFWDDLKNKKLATGLPVSRGGLRVVGDGVTRPIKLNGGF